MRLLQNCLRATKAAEEEEQATEVSCVPPNCLNACRLTSLSLKSPFISKNIVFCCYRQFHERWVKIYKAKISCATNAD